MAAACAWGAAGGPPYRAAAPTGPAQRWSGAQYRFPAAAATAASRAAAVGPTSRRQSRGARPSAAAASASEGSSGRRSPSGAAAPATSGRVEIAIEPGPSNSRCIWAGVDVAAPAQAVYAALTSYEQLGGFIPGLAENRCLERYSDGCRLLQVGQQDLALGLKFCARVCLRIREHPTGMPTRLLSRSPNSRRRPASSGGSSNGSSSGGEGGGWAALPAWWPLGGPGSRSGPGSLGIWAGGSASGSGWGASSSGSGSSGSDDDGGWTEWRYLRPRSPLGASASCLDISFELLEGDFAAFKGLWRMQPAGGGACRLSYTLFVRPQPWLLVGLIEERIQGEIAANLAAVKAHVERQMAAGASAAGAAAAAGGAARGQQQQGPPPVS